MSEPQNPNAARLTAIQQSSGGVVASAEAPPPTLREGNGEAHGPRAAAAPTDDDAELTGEEEALVRACTRLHRVLIEQIDPRQQRPDANWIAERARLLVANVATAEGIAATPRNRNLLISGVIDEILAFGPIQPLFDDPTISEIIVNGARSIWVEREGVLERTRVVFADNTHVMRIVQKMLAAAGRRVDEGSPMADASLPDGSRLNVVVPPVSITGAAMTIRKHSRAKLSLDQLVERGTLTEGMSQFLRACVVGKLNLLISGGTSSGKTSMLNALAAFISRHERLITIEDSAELQIRHPGLLGLQSRPPNSEGAGEVSIRDLVRNALRMRPDRIIVGEVRGSEAIDMLQAMLTGHRGSLSTIHGNSPQDALDRLETMSLMAGIDLPAASIRKQVASAIHLLIQQDRSPDGKRRITHVTEIIGMEEETILVQNIFEFRRTGLNEQGHIIGHHFATGIIPRCLDRLRAEGVEVPGRSCFERGEAR